MCHLGFGGDTLELGRFGRGVVLDLLQLAPKTIRFFADRIPFGQSLFSSKTMTFGVGVGLVQLGTQLLDLTLKLRSSGVGFL